MSDFRIMITGEVDDEGTTRVGEADTEVPARSALGRRSTVILVVVLLIPGAIQILGGYDDVGLLEEWGFFELYSRQGPLFFLGTDSAVASQAMRPLTLFPSSVAWLIDNDSFRGLHIAQAVGLSLRCASMYLLLVELRVGRRIAVAVGLTFSLFPAWTGLFVFRTAHFHLASAMITTAAWLLLRSRERDRRAEWLAIAVATVVGLMAYEGYYSVVAFVPLLLLVNGRIPVKRFILLSVVWFVGPVLNGLRILWIMAFGPPQYQEALVTERGRDAQEVIRLFGRTFRGAGQALIDPPFGHRMTWLGALAIGVTLFALWTIADGGGTTGRRRAWLLSATCALAVMPVTTLVYWPQPAHLVDPLRIFSVAAFPASIAVACLLAAIPGFRKRNAISSLVVTSALLASFGQRAHWHEASQFQERLLGAIALEMAASGMPTEVVLFDVDRRTGGVYTLLEPHTTIAMQYLFSDPSKSVTICQSTPEEVAAFPPGSPCHSEGGSITGANGNSILLETALVLQLKDGDLTVVSAPDGDPVPLPSRVRAALQCVGDGVCLPIPSFTG